MLRYKLNGIYVAINIVDDAYTDFCNAFDRVSHNYLIADKLSAIGVHSFLLKCMRPYVSVFIFEIALNSTYHLGPIVIQSFHK